MQYPYIQKQPVRVHSTQSVQFFSLPVGSDNAVAVIPPGTVEKMFYHEYQTDQLVCVNGALVLVLLINGKLEYQLMTAANPEVITIPARVPHSGVNLGTENCVLFNARIIHEQRNGDLIAISPPEAYDYREIQRLYQQLHRTT